MGDASDRIQQGADGIFRWTYEVNLWKNAHIFYDYVKVIGITLGLVYGLMLVIGIFQADNWEVVWTMVQAFLCVAVGLFLLCLMGYGIWAAVNGGRYVALFEMDDTGITHCMMKKDVKRQQIVSSIGVLVGLATGKPGVIGNSLMAASVNKWRSGFASVRKVQALRHRDLIKVSGRLTQNQIFVEHPEDYAFVLDYILRHCPQVKQ